MEFEDLTLCNLLPEVLLPLCNCQRLPDIMTWLRLTKISVVIVPVTK